MFIRNIKIPTAISRNQLFRGIVLEFVILLNLSENHMKLHYLKQQLKTRSTRFPIYLDYQSTTPVDPRVVEDMLPYFTQKFGNPDSKSHAFGFEAEAAVSLARKQVADALTAREDSIFFTSSATEANNLAIFGIADSCKAVITLSTEHKSVLEPLKQLQKTGMHITYLPVQQNGLVDLNILMETIIKAKLETTGTVLVSIMAVHNEIGVIQPLEEIGKICNSLGALFHSDITQGFGKIPIDVIKCNIDLASISGHKIYGPKGIGAIYARSNLKLKPLLYGGGQENGIRSSTLAVPLIVGLGRAAEISTQEMRKDYEHIKKLYDTFLNHMPPDITLNGDKDKRWQGNINMVLRRSTSSRDLAISAGAACASGSTEASYTLRALGLSDDEIKKSIRIGFGRFTTEEEIEYAAAVILEDQNK
jgi:cysteine desulfurase